MENSTTEGEKSYDEIIHKRREKWVKLFSKFETADGNDVEIPIMDLPVQSNPTKKIGNIYRRATANATAATNDRRSPNDLRAILNSNEDLPGTDDVQNSSVIVDRDSDHSTETDSENSAEFTDSDDENKAYVSQKKGRRRRGNRSVSDDGDGYYRYLHITNATGDSGDELLDDLEEIINSNGNVDEISFSDYEDTDTVSEYSAEFSDAEEEDSRETQNVSPAEKKRKLSDSEPATEDSKVKRRDTSMYKEVNLYINAVKADFDIDSD